MILTQCEEDLLGVSDNKVLRIKICFEEEEEVTLNIFSDSARAPTASVRE